MKWQITAAGYAVALLFFFLWIGARENLAEERAESNARTMASIAKASEVARDAERAANEARIAQLSEFALKAELARQDAEEAARIAEAKPAVVRTVIKEVAGENECLNTAMPVELLDSLRQ